MQRYATKNWPRSSEGLDQLLVAAQRLVKEAKVQIERGNSEFLEIGAGRDLAVAIALRLMGVQKVTCIDISYLAKIDLVKHAAKLISLKLNKPCPEIETWEDLKNFGISYIAPCDIVLINVPPQTIDCFYSIDTLEHIPTASLHNVLLKVHNILKNDGIAINFIDYSDHYARGTTLSRFNFLKYSEEQWAAFNTKLHYTNRMRHSEYLNLLDKTGFTSLKIEADVADVEPDIFTNLAKEFSKFSIEDLFTTRAMIVSTVK